MIKYIISLTHGFRGRITISAVSGIIRVAIGLVFVALSKNAVDIATGRAEGNLVLCIAGLIGAVIIELICSAVGSRNTELSEAEMRNTLQERLFSRVLNTTWSGRESFHSGDMMSRLTEDIRVAAECLCKTFPIIIIAIFQLIGAFLFLWHFSPSLALVLILILPVFMFAGKIFFKKVQRLTHRIREIESHVQENMQESLQHRVLLLTCQQTRRTLEAISALNSSRLDVIRKRTKITVYSRTAVFAGFQSGYLAAFVWGVIGLRNGTVSYGLMTAYLQLAGQIQRPLAELARLLPGLIQSHTSFSRIYSIEQMPVEEEPIDSEQAENSQPAGISLSNITFGYKGKGKPIFNHFNHTFLPGSHTAIMGETGAGKSTLLRLILALVKPEEGNIELFRMENGNRIPIPVSMSTRSQIVYVPQGNSLLSGTIRKNLFLGNPDATEEEIWDALHTAAADFVHNLPNGLDTVCGEHGDGLSEGQAQRIAIARGLLRKGSILLLDEVSASLDEETEKLLMQRLKEIRGSHTVLLVTHRPGVLPYCDDILRIPSTKYINQNSVFIQGEIS